MSAESVKIEVENKVVEKNVPVTKSKKPTEKELKWEADRDMELVSGVFKNHENPGETLKFWFRAHPGQEIEKYELKDGEVCKIPLAVARHLRKNLWVGVDEYAIDPQTGLQAPLVGKKIRRASFYLIDYVDHEDLDEVGVPFIQPRV